MSRKQKSTSVRRIKMRKAGKGWGAGETPWVREQLSGDPFGARGYAQCYFCGEHTAKVSGGDLPGDNGRVEIYCDNTSCEAREVAVVVLRDGSKADTRADVRLLRAIDNDTHSTDWPPVEVVSWEGILDRTGNDGEVVARRTSRDPVTYSAPGWDTSGAAKN
ncbi:hypothetical protein [Leifsonia xyli]|uniref:hypothetical protein n=1 Tax=Leifsonia xyli TaxID=1575 RepID=UPI003D66CDC8